MNCAFCGTLPAIRVNRIGKVLKVSCGTCVWKHSLSVRFDGYNLRLRRTRSQNGTKTRP